MPKLSVGTAAFLLSSALALPAQAAATSSATLGPLVVSLFDLDPGDGIAPGVTFSTASSPYGTWVSAEAFSGVPAEFDDAVVSAPGSFDPLAAGAVTSLSSAAAALSGPGLARGTRLTASGEALGTLDGTPFGFQSSSYAGQVYAPFNSVELVVTPRTLLVISARATVSAAITQVWDSTASYQWEEAFATTGLLLLGAGGQRSDDSLEVGVTPVAFSGPGCAPGACLGGDFASASRRLAVGFLNLARAEQTAYFQAQASVAGYSYAQIVPEPGPGLLMAAGLLALGGRLRRSR